MTADGRSDATRVAGYVATGIGVYSRDFGRYPWPELNVVEAPMPAGVGGMEWQGMFWIGPDMFTGTLPGLGGLGSLGGSTGSPIDTQSISEFTVVHELAHQWWQGIVGLDQTAYEVIDEPLAQFSGCLYFRTVHPGTAAGACALNVTMNYQMMRLLGMPDAPANRPTYSYSNPLVYAGIVYGKAPGFYDAVGKAVGEKRLLAGLQHLISAHPFGIVRPHDVVAAMQSAAPDHASQISGLWTRWMQQAAGDKDIDLTSGPLGGLMATLKDNPWLAQVLRSLLGG